MSETLLRGYPATSCSYLALGTRSELGTWIPKINALAVLGIWAGGKRRGEYPQVRDVRRPGHIQTFGPAVLDRDLTESLSTIQGLFYRDVRTNCRLTGKTRIWSILNEDRDMSQRVVL